MCHIAASKPALSLPIDPRVVKVQFPAFDQIESGFVTSWREFTFDETKPLLGKGGNSDGVLKAWDNLDGVPVALKVVNLCSTKHRLEQGMGDLTYACKMEVATSYLLGGHPNIMKSYKVMIQGSYMILALQLVPQAITLRRWMDVQRKKVLKALKMGEPDFSDLELQILAIMYLRLNSTVHTDLKPQNFMVYIDEVTSIPHILLIDFGLSRILPDFMLQPSACTRSYAPPEVLSDSVVTVDGSAFDSYSLGVIFVELGSIALRDRVTTPVNNICRDENGDVILPEGWAIFGEIGTVVYQLLSIDPAARPTAESIWELNCIKHLRCLKPLRPLRLRDKDIRARDEMKLPSKITAELVTTLSYWTTLPTVV
ncbi:hypothetical protein HDU93_007492 [Gonapodya sp. JEL0774]|nr:hypothetical protein HDU93_007492 [Gonapodya sp. JEL0774]